MKKVVGIVLLALLLAGCGGEWIRGLPCETKSSDHRIPDPWTVGGHASNRGAVECIDTGIILVVRYTKAGEVEWRFH